jgi:cobalt/nickel transport protein
VKKYRTALLLLLAAALTALPLVMVNKPAPGPDGGEVDMFTGSDDQAMEVISTIAPDYSPWAQPVREPPSSEGESLLFALQAALGVGFIAYYVGVSVTRARMRRERERQGKC